MQTGENSIIETCIFYHSNSYTYIAKVRMDRIRIGYPAGYLPFFGSGLDLDIYF